MAFPKKLLASGEQIILESNPNWSILAPRSAVFLLVVAIAITVVALWTNVPNWMGWLLLACVLAALIWLMAKVTVWRSTSLVLTNMRVVYRAGVLRRLGREIPLDRVQDVTYEQSLFERMVGAGSLTIQSAGLGGDEPFPDIRHPAEVQSTINQLIAQTGGSGGGLGGRFGGGYAQQPVAPRYQQPPAPQQYEQPPQQYQPPPQQSYPQSIPPQQYQQLPPQGYPQQPSQGYGAPPQPYGAPQHYTPGPGQHQAPYQEQQQAPQYHQQVRPGTYAGEPVTPPVAVPAVSDDVANELAHLNQMHELGVITDAELEQKRRQLLRGN